MLRYTYIACLVRNVIHAFSGKCFRRSQQVKNLISFKKCHTYGLCIPTQNLCVHVCTYCFYGLKRMCSGSCYTNIYPENNIKIILLITLYFFTNSAEDALFGYIGCFFFPI